MERCGGEVAKEDAPEHPQSSAIEAPPGEVLAQSFHRGRSGPRVNWLDHASILEVENELGRHPSTILPSTPASCEAKFQATLGEVQARLSDLSGLVTLLAQQHEYEMDMAKAFNTEATPTPTPTASAELGAGAVVKDDNAAGSDVEDEQESPPARAGSATTISPTKEVTSVPSMPSSRLSMITTSSADDIDGELATRMHDAIVDGRLDRVMRLLSKGVSPNLTLSGIELFGMSISTCPCLVLAVLHKEAKIVQALMMAEADPSLEYSFLAGAEQIMWSGPAVHGPIPSGDLPMLKELVRLKADLNVSSSNGATLVWQAAYFGQKAILTYLLEQGLDPETPAMSQDDTSIVLTPLHIAAKTGQLGTVTTLLDHSASYLVDDGHDSQPLDDAVANGHSDVVQLLIARGADVFRRAAGGDETETINCCRCIDRVFSQNNHVLIAAVAKGLKETRHLSSLFRKSDLIKFLATPGDAPVEIWGAIFRPHVFRYWEAKSSKVRRGIARAAFVNREVGMNIALGPHPTKLQEFFNKKRVLPSECRGFKERLARTKVHRRHDIFMPVSFYGCSLRGLQDDLQVILGIVDCTREEVFGVAGCRAIIELKWETERAGAQIRTIMALIEVVNLVLVNMILNATTEKIVVLSRETCLTAANAFAFAIWLIVMAIEMAQALGYMLNGLAKRYFLDLRHIFDFFVLMLTGCIMIWTAMDGVEVTYSSTYRILLGFIVCLKWARLLISLRAMKSVGLRILPILNTMWDVGPFLGVLAVYLMGAVNMFYAIGKHTITEAFLIVYRLVVLGDVDMGELEGQELLRFRINNAGSVVEQVPAMATEYREVVRIVMVIVSFVMGISMMNLFVAMLCVSYSEAMERAPLAFVRTVAGIVLDQQATRNGFQRLFMCCPGRKRRRRRSSGMPMPHNVSGIASSRSNGDEGMSSRTLTDCSTTYTATTRASGHESQAETSDSGTTVASATKACLDMLPWVNHHEHAEYHSYIWFSEPLKPLV